MSANVNSFLQSPSPPAGKRRHCGTLGMYRKNWNHVARINCFFNIADLIKSKTCLWPKPRGEMSLERGFCRNWQWPVAKTAVFDWSIWHGSLMLFCMQVLFVFIVTDFYARIYIYIYTLECARTFFWTTSNIYIYICIYVCLVWIARTNMYPRIPFDGVLIQFSHTVRPVRFKFCKLGILIPKVMFRISKVNCFWSLVTFVAFDF